METICVSKIDAPQNSKLFEVLTAIRIASENASEYTVYADHSDYCIGLFDNG